ncbi:MAG: radical SAM protein [Elusimicrobia bacterium]|nr:radical SAM protein [Elusimicrobiota bacterium]
MATVAIQTHHEMPQLADLWFLVGSRCNLACIHCYVASSPTNDFLEQMTLDEVKRFLSEGTRYGMQNVYFTGGEPFIVRDIIPMLEAALETGGGSRDGEKPGTHVTVLTNATAPIQRYLTDLVRLHTRFEERFTLRVSLDHYEETRHDAIRGEGNFQRTVANARRLMEEGLRVIITTTGEVFRGNPLTPDRVIAAYQALFPGFERRVEVKILPAILAMGAQLERIDAPAEWPTLTPQRLEDLQVDTTTLMCRLGRSVLKREGICRVYPCPIIYEVPDFELGPTLEASFRQAVPLSHSACASYCCRGNSVGTCANTPKE